MGTKIATVLIFANLAAASTSAADEREVVDRWRLRQGFVRAGWKDEVPGTPTAKSIRLKVQRPPEVGGRYQW